MPKLCVLLYSCCPVWQLVVVHLLRYVNIVIKRLLLLLLLLLLYCRSTERRADLVVYISASARRHSVHTVMPFMSVIVVVIENGT